MTERIPERPCKIIPRDTSDKGDAAVGEAFHLINLSDIFTTNLLGEGLDSNQNNLLIRLCESSRYAGSRDTEEFEKALSSFNIRHLVPCTECKHFNGNS